jgi:hypothetical protein
MKIRTTRKVAIAGRTVAAGTELVSGSDIAPGMAAMLVRLKLAVAIETPAPAPAPAPAPEPVASIEDAPNRMLTSDAAPVRKRAPRKKAAE